MRLAVWSLLVLSTASCPASAGREGQTSCVAYSDALRAEQQAAADATEAALAAELQRRGLQEVRLSLRSADPGTTPVGSLASLPRGGQLLVAGARGMTMDRVTSLRFAEDAVHALYAIDLQPTFVVDTGRQICGCSNSGRGTVQQFTGGYQIPADRQYQGPLAIPFKGKRVTWTWTEKTPDGRPCPRLP